NGTHPGSSIVAVAVAEVSGGTALSKRQRSPPQLAIKRIRYAHADKRSRGVRFDECQAGLIEDKGVRTGGINNIRSAAKTIDIEGNSWRCALRISEPSQISGGVVGVAGGNVSCPSASLQTAGRTHGVGDRI